MAETAETDTVPTAVAAADMAHSKYVDLAAKDMARVVMAEMQVRRGSA